MDLTTDSARPISEMKASRGNGSSSCRQPLFWTALAFAAGTALGCQVWRPGTWWLLAAVIFMNAAVWWNVARPATGNGTIRDWRLGLAWVLALASVAALG